MVTSGLVGFWPLNEWSGGRANDLSGNDNHGTNNGPTQGILGRGGLTCYSYDTSTDWTDLSTLTLPREQTIMFWMNKQGTYGSERPMVIRGSRFDGNQDTGFGRNGFELVGDELWVRESNSDSQTNFETGIYPNENEWVHITISNDDGTIYSYKNGEFVNSNDQFSIRDLDAIAEDGSAVGGGSGMEHFNGYIFDLRVYNRRLTQGEIDEVYRKSTQNLATPPDADDANAVSRYSFDDRSDTSTALDSFGSNDGAINGATYSADSVRGLSLDFGGSGYVSVPDSDEFSYGDGSSDTPFTVSYWFKANTLGGGHISKAGGASAGEWYVIMSSAGELFFRLVDDSAGAYIGQSSEAILNSDSWYNFVGTYDGTGSSSGIQIYVNGAPINNTPSNSGTYSAMENTVENVELGRRGAGTEFDGEMDDFRIYSRELSGYEIQQLYRYGSPGVDLRSELVEQ